MKTINLGDGKTTITSPYMNLVEAALYCNCPETVITDAMLAREVDYCQFTEQTIVFTRDCLDAFVKDHEVLSRYNYLDDPPDDEDPRR